MLQILLEATYDTLRIVFIASIFIILMGIPLGLFLEATNNNHILGNKYLWAHKLLHAFINFFSDIPTFLILILLLPIINKVLFAHFTIELSAVISIICIGTLIFANDVFNTLHNLPDELSDTAKFLGAEPMQILTKFLLPEAMQDLVHNITKLIIHLLGLAILSSALGVNGLGQLALEKSYVDLELSYVFCIILLSAGIIYIIKFLGRYIANLLDHKLEQPSSASTSL